MVWLGPDPLPAEFEPFLESWRRHHPDWELKLWGEDNLPADLRRPEVYDTERQPVERADILRLELIWRFGGVYVDTDFECYKPIDELIEGADFFTGLMKREAPTKAGAPKPARVNNAIFGAVPGHPLLDRALEELRVHEIGARYDKHLSGAMFFNALVMDSPDVTTFPPEFFYPATEQEREQAYGLHHAARLWHDVEGLRIIMRRAETRLEKTAQRLEKEQQLRERDQRLHERELQKLEAENRDLVEQLALVKEQRVRSLDILFFLEGIHFDRVFEPFLRALLERGHEMHVALSLEKRGLPEDEDAALRRVPRALRASRTSSCPGATSRWLLPAIALRHGLDYLRYLEPEFAHARASSRAGTPARAAARPRARRAPFCFAAGRPPRLGAMLAQSRRRSRSRNYIVGLVEARKPDVVLVSPLVGHGLDRERLHPRRAGARRFRPSFRSRAGTT